MDYAVFSQCKMLRFEAPDEAWLDFVSANRAGNYQGNFVVFALSSIKWRGA